MRVRRGGAGAVRTTGLAVAVLLGSAIGGCATADPQGDSDPLEALGIEQLDCTLVEAGYFFVPANASGRVHPSLRDRLRSMGYDGSKDVRTRKRTESGPGYTREIIEGYEGVGLKYRDPACRHRINPRAGGTGA
ncbi:MAG: hypothetical protein RLN75_01960 [Longimicrobiales bacterium]